MKLDRLLAIIMLMLNRDRICAKELAEYFEVSLRTIQRDIDAINQAGIPVVSYQGKNGGYGIMENYRIDRYVLTPEEIYSIINALSGVGRGIGDRKMNNLSEKLKSLIPRNDLAALHKDKRFIIDLSPWMENKAIKEKLDLINEAINDGRLLRFVYTSNKGETLDRTVEPMALILKDSLWYLYGYCRLREDFRMFRLSRINDLQLCAERFVRREKDLEEYPWQKYWGAPVPTVDLVLRFAPRTRVRVQDSFDTGQIEIEEDGSLLVRTTYPLEEYLYGLILSYGDAVEVLAPEELRLEIMKRGKRIWELYSKK